ncbi:Ctr copper transporter family-domain-containing protein [Cladochytrium replicatum]|nr:Ctr copper transporter family-domain-containing protein [Cladochytrium replicatum]
MSHNHNHGSSSDSSSMAMFFTLNASPSILFKDWVPTSRFDYFLVFFTMAGMGIIVEALGYLRPRVPAKIGASRPKDSLTEKWWSPATSPDVWKRSLAKFALRLLEVGGSYLLMLAAMSFDLVVVVSVILGLGIGYACFLPVTRRPGEIVSATAASHGC